MYEYPPYVSIEAEPTAAPQRGRGIDDTKPSVNLRAEGVTAPDPQTCDIVLCDCSSTGGAIEGSSSVHYQATAQFLQSCIPEIIDSYKSSLLAVRSPLATRRDAWPKCREQAQTILEDCITALSGDQPPEAGEARRYSQLVGADRASQGIAMAESIRAVEILWNAMQPAVRRAVQREAPARQVSSRLLISTAFRSSAGIRLYAGAIGYGEAVNRATRGVANDVSAAGTPGVPPTQAAAYAELSQREREVLDGVARALTNGQIARELGIQTATVKRHLNNVYGKLQAQSRIDAVNKAFGLVHGRSSPEEDQGTGSSAR